MGLKLKMAKVEKRGDSYRSQSLAYATGNVPMPIPAPIDSSAYDLFQCFDCGKALHRRRFPKSDCTTCKACLRKRGKLQNKRLKVARRVSAEKAQFADKLRRNMTLAEQRLWVKLSCLMPVFSAQTIVFGYIADFACVHRKMIIEVDGPIHEERQAYDRQRDDNLRRRGFRTLRFSNDRVMQDRQGVLGEIMEAL